MMETKKRKSKQLRIDNELFHILQKVKLDNEKWSKTARRYLMDYCLAMYPEVVDEIEKAYQLADDAMVKEIIKND